MKPLRINNKSKEDVLVKIAMANGMDVNDLLAVYLLLGDDLFFLFKVLSGKNVKIPHHNRLSEVGNNESIKIIEVESSDDYVEGELIELGNNLYKVTKEPQKIFNHWYVIVEEYND